ncbi:MAG: hypothetical protein JWP06_739 [Candidatus Saccharibacteria bacterium]|nr:hypothetical protein [Candidatus Saccharibacteria bacterium]
MLTWYHPYTLFGTLKEVTTQTSDFLYETMAECKRYLSDLPSEF